MYGHIIRALKLLYCKGMLTPLSQSIQIYFGTPPRAFRIQAACLMVCEVTRRYRQNHLVTVPQPHFKLNRWVRSTLCCRQIQYYIYLLTLCNLGRMLLKFGRSRSMLLFQQVCIRLQILLSPEMAQNHRLHSCRCYSETLGVFARVHSWTGNINKNGKNNKFNSINNPIGLQCNILCAKPLE